jgi:hypothetical protein
MARLVSVSQPCVARSGFTLMGVDGFRLLFSKGSPQAIQCGSGSGRSCSAPASGEARTDLVDARIKRELLDDELPSAAMSATPRDQVSLSPLIK